MKNLFLRLSVVAIFIFCLAACQSNTPASVAEKFTVAMAKGDIETAKTFMVDEAKPLLDLALSMGQMETYDNFSFTLVKETIDGDEAVITYKSPEEEEADINLRKVDDEWKVYIEK